MAILPQTHHGMNVADLARTKAALRAIGYTATQPGAPEPLEFRNVEGDPVGQQTAHALGDRYITHYIENPDTGHQIDLIEIGPEYLQERPSREPAQGDLTIAVPVADPVAAYHTLRAAWGGGDFSEPVACPEEDGVRFFGCDGQDFLFTRQPAGFAVIHYSTRDFPQARRFYEEVLGYSVIPAGSDRPGVERFRLDGCGGRMEIEVRPGVAVPDYQATAKRYPGANHFRLLNIDMNRVSDTLARDPGLGGFLLGPYESGFAFLYGPANETPECFDMSMFARAMAAPGA
ncbi:MAG: VOC family protein [Dehalococcoidia bacterium]